MDAEPRTREKERRAKRRRRADKFTFRDLVYLAGIVLVAIASYLAFESNETSTKADRHASAAIAAQARVVHAQAQLVRRVQEGRRTAITITCAAISSFGAAGKAVIAGSPTPPPPAQERAFEALGFPPFAARHIQQSHAGDLYVKAISRRINRELRELGERPVEGLVRKDGTIDCGLLQKVAATTGAR